MKSSVELVSHVSRQAVRQALFITASVHGRVLTARRTIGSQSGLTKYRVDRVGCVDLSNTYYVIVLVMGLGLGLSLCGSTVGHPYQQLGFLLIHVVA